MAKQTFIKLLDDIDGSAASETVRFGLDGVGYEIDLSDVHAKELREIMAPFVDVATKVTGRILGRPVVVRSDRDKNRRVREWAEATGREVAARGRIPQSVVDAFDAAHS